MRAAPLQLRAAERHCRSALHTRKQSGRRKSKGRDKLTSSSSPEHFMFALPCLPLAVPVAADE